MENVVSIKNDDINNPAYLKIDLMLKGIRVEGSDKDVYVLGGRTIGLTSRGLDIVLPNNTLVNVPYGDEFTKVSPYVLKSEGGRFYIAHGAGKVPVKIVPTPEFYKHSTSTGVPFSEIGTLHGSYVVITPSLKCELFNQDAKCRYCAVNFDAGDPVKTYSVDEVLETVEAVLKDGMSEIIYLSIGFTEGEDGGIKFLTPYIEAIKKHFNCLVAVEALPPKTNEWIDETYAVGADSVLYNLEIFDEELFKVISPGRAKSIGRDRYIEALKYAAGVFPNGTVASHLVLGLEPPGSTCAGIDMLTSIGVVPIVPIYRPSENWALRIDPLSTDIIIPVYKHLYNAVKKNNINMNWVRDISMVTTPIEGRFLTGDNGGIRSIFESFYKTKIGLKTAWGLSTLRRKLRVKTSHHSSGV